MERPNKRKHQQLEDQMSKYILWMHWLKHFKDETISVFNTNSEISKKDLVDLLQKYVLDHPDHQLHEILHHLESTSVSLSDGPFVNTLVQMPLTDTELSTSAYNYGYRICVSVVVKMFLQKIATYKLNKMMSKTLTPEISNYLDIFVQEDTKLFGMVHDIILKLYLKNYNLYNASLLISGMYDYKVRQDVSQILADLFFM